MAQQLNFVTCPKCRARVNDSVPACPQCGEKISVEDIGDIPNVRHRPLESPEREYEKNTAQIAEDRDRVD